MIKRIELKGFKSFLKAELSLGPFNLLIGTNASGKSNIRDAFRFLHGVARGYALHEIAGQKWGEGGRQEWAGIRGGPNEMVFTGHAGFEVSVDYNLASTLTSRASRGLQEYSYTIEVGGADAMAQVRSEELDWVSEGKYVYSTHPAGKPLSVPFVDIKARCLVATEPKAKRKLRTFDARKPIFSQLFRAVPMPLFDPYFGFITNFLGMRFLDHDPDAMRQPSFPGQSQLGDRGENLASVLMRISEDSERKAQILHWLRELTPMEVTDLRFETDPLGKVYLMFVDPLRDKPLSAYSASDGTLRFLGTLAALMQPDQGPFLFIEELDNGIHPARLHLLLQMIEDVTAEGKTQVVATTHSPQLLALLSESAFQHAYLTYRLEGQPDTRIKRIAELPEILRLREKYGLARLHESGWFEKAIAALSEVAEQ